MTASFVTTVLTGGGFLYFWYVYDSFNIPLLVCGAVLSVVLIYIGFMFQDIFDVTNGGSKQHE